MIDDLVALGRYGATSALVTRDGEIVERASNILVLFRPAWPDEPLLQRPDVKVFDLAELWAVVKPGHNAPPTIQGMLDKIPKSAEESACYLYELLDHLMTTARLQMADLAPYLAWVKGQEQGYHWPWLDWIMPENTAPPLSDITDIVKDITKWTTPPDFTPHDLVSQQAFRPDQTLYHKGLQDFLAAPNGPKTLLAVGGTGVGKTRAYLSAAKDQGQVWVSTFTRALQRQVQSEAMTRLGLPAHIRKGRDNYVCLKLLQEAWERAPHWADGLSRVGLMAMLRWVHVTHDGDMTGATFPGWMTTLFGPPVTLDLTDRKKECTYNACRFYTQCYAERSRAWAVDAPLVIANHAVVAGLMHRGQTMLPPTLIMDEAHHVEHVADEVLTGGVSLHSATELGRFLLGIAGDGRRRGRKGFLDILAENLPDTDKPLIQAALKAANILPVMNALDRLRSGQTIGPLEGWLLAVYRTVMAHTQDEAVSSAYDRDLPRDLVPMPDLALVTSITQLMDALQAIMYRMEQYDREASLEQSAPIIDSKRDALQNAIMPLRLWLTQWGHLSQPLGTPHIEWAAIKQEDGQVRDIGLYRAWRDPLSVWQTITENQMGAVIYTTATPTPALLTMVDSAQLKVDSPFDYSVQSRVIILTDVEINNDRSVAKILAALLSTAGGGALAVFTAIARLRRVYDLMKPLCDRADIHLLAQHVDAMDVATLIDIFRSEPRCAMLGTDAVRDGVDIPGDALRLLVFDRVPWPRPDLLHKVRRETHGGRHYDEDLVRLKLKQAFGRLIRSETDRGVFVMLDSRLPSRLYDAFPVGVPIHRMALAETLVELGHFFDNPRGIIAA